MRHYHYIFIITILLTMHSCATKVVDHDKNPLEKIFVSLDSIWTEDEKVYFKNLPDSALIDYHMNEGMWIRNKWLRGKNQDTILVDYMINLGFKSPDDISSAILKTYHMRLNNKEFDLTKLAEPYRKYWDNIAEESKRYRELAISNYNRYSVGDTINILMSVSVDSTDMTKNAVKRQSDWTFDAEKDLDIKGEITNKYFVNSESNVFFLVKIVDMNYPQIDILMNETRIGDTISLSLDRLKIAQKNKSTTS